MKQFRTISGLLTVISLFFGVIWLSPALAADVPTFASLGQIKVGALRVAGAMDLDAAGNLYVADVRSRKVHKFSPYGALLQSFDVDASGPGLAVAADGTRLYVSREDSVAVVDAASAEVVGVLAGSETAGAEFQMAGEIDLDAAGRVFVVDSGRSTVKVFDAAGQYIKRFGSAGQGAGQFLQISGMTISPAGQLVVTDSAYQYGKVTVFTLDTSLGLVTTSTYANGTAANFGTPAMTSPRGVAFDAAGRGYVLDYMTSRVRVVAPNFTYLGAYLNKGYGVGQLDYVIDAAFDVVNSRLFVSCGGGRVEILGVDGGQNPVSVNHAPTVPAPTEPVAGSEVASVTPTLAFAAASDEDGDALTYNVVVSGQDGVVFEANVATTTVVVDVALTENAAYSWTVQASDGAAVSEVSVPANFVVNAVEEAPLAPVLTSPVGGETVDGAAVLAWEATTDPDPNDTVVAYQVQVARDADFADGLIIESAMQTSLGLADMVAYVDLVDGAAYFWRVVAIDNEKVASEPSEAGQFVYDTTALTVTANMPGAVVSLGGNHAYAGQVIGVAPLELRDFAPGSYSVVVERAGFEPFVAQVALNENDNVNVYAELVPAMAVNNLSVSRRGINGRSGLQVSGDAAPFLVDFDNDGDLDMIAAAESGRLTLFPNLQVEGPNRLTFDSGVALSPTGIVPFVADWNNDGRKDLVVGQANGTVKLYLNNGLEQAPAFAAGVDVLPVSVGLDAAPAVVDFNGDGAKDLLVGNASGQVLFFANTNNDAAPVFSGLGQPVLQLSGNVVPMPVDWNADGVKELLVTNGGAVTVYAMADGQYQAVAEFSERRGTFFAAFPIALDGTGKQLLAGKADGELVYVTGNGSEPVAAFAVALQDKVAELGGLVADEAPQQLDAVNAIAGLVAAGEYLAAADATGLLAAQLPDGAAKQSALELLALL